MALMDLEECINMSAIPRIQHPDRIINQLQQNLITGISQLQQEVTQSPSNGTFLTTSLLTGNNILQHNLGHIPNGYLITSNDSPAIIYKVDFSKFTVTLNASQPVNIVLFLF